MAPEPMCLATVALFQAPKGIGQVNQVGSINRVSTVFQTSMSPGTATDGSNTIKQPPGLSSLFHRE